MKCYNPLDMNSKSIFLCIYIYSPVYVQDSNLTFSKKIYYLETLELSVARSRSTHNVLNKIHSSKRKCRKELALIYKGTDNSR